MDTCPCPGFSDWRRKVGGVLRANSLGRVSGIYCMVSKHSPLKLLVLERQRRKGRGPSFGNSTDEDLKAQNIFL